MSVFIWIFLHGSDLGRFPIAVPSDSSSSCRTPSDEFVFKHVLNIFIGKAQFQFEWCRAK